MKIVWLPRATIHLGPDVLRPHKRPEIRVQSDLVPQQRKTSVLENQEGERLREESRYGVLGRPREVVATSLADGLV